MKYFSIILLTLIFVVSIKAQTATVIVENANLRGTPRESGKVVETLPSGAKGTVLQQKGAWFLLQTDDYVGWIHGNTIKVDNESSLQTVPLKQSTKSKPTSTRSSESRTYLRGSRGGCYYLNSNGNKTYVERSFCN